MLIVIGVTDSSGLVLNLIKPYPKIKQLISVIIEIKRKLLIIPSLIMLNISMLIDIIQKLTPKTPVISAIWIMMLSGHTKYPIDSDGKERNTSDRRISIVTHEQTNQNRRAVLLIFAFKPKKIHGMKNA